MSSDLISEFDSHSNEYEESTPEKESSVETITMPKEFQDNVVKFVKLDESIRLKQKELAELREKKKPCEQYIIKYLESVKQDEVSINNGKIKKNKSETKGAINQEIIKAVIAKKISDPMIVEELLKGMEEVRPTNSKVGLKITKGGDKVAKKVNKK